MNDDPKTRQRTDDELRDCETGEMTDERNETDGWTDEGKIRETEVMKDPDRQADDEWTRGWDHRMKEVGRMMKGRGD